MRKSSFANSSCIHTYTHTHAHIHTYTRTSVPTYTCTNTQTEVHAYTHQKKVLIRNFLEQQPEMHAYMFIYIWRKSTFANSSYKNIYTHSHTLTCMRIQVCVTHLQKVLIRKFLEQQPEILVQFLAVVKALDPLFILFLPCRRTHNPCMRWHGQEAASILTSFLTLHLKTP